MSVGKINRIEQHYQERHEETPHAPIVAKVVFIDKSDGAVRPYIYQLKDYALSKTPPDLLKSEAFSFDHEAFVLLGEVEIHDKWKKKVTLSNEKVVFYTHLVVIYENKLAKAFFGPEFSSGLKALVDAVRLKPLIPRQAVTQQAVTHSHKTSKVSTQLPEENEIEGNHPRKNPQKNIERLASPLIQSTPHKQTDSDISSKKKVYEVNL